MEVPLALETPRLALREGRSWGWRREGWPTPPLLTTPGRGGGSTLSERGAGAKVRRGAEQFPSLLLDEAGERGDEGRYEEGER